MAGQEAYLHVRRSGCAKSTIASAPFVSSNSESTNRAISGSKVINRSGPRVRNRSSNHSKRSRSSKESSINKNSKKMASTMVDSCYIAACMLLSRIWGNFPVLPIGTLPGGNGCAASVETRNLYEAAAAVAEVAVAAVVVVVVVVTAIAVAEVG